MYEEVVQLDSVVHDVQARQQIAIDHGIRLAKDQGFDWLLHIDADEILFCPDTSRHQDVRHFFAEVPCNYTLVRFANLEAVPETFEVTDCFQEVTLFKMSRMLLRDCGRCGDLYTDMQNDLFALTNTMNSPGSEGGLIQMPEQMYDATANV